MPDRTTRRRDGAGCLVDVAVERRSEVPLARQVYLALRTAIVAGRLPAGARLASTRDGAATWNVSRGVVIEAYELLIGEGYAIGQIGSGTYAAPGAWGGLDTPGRGAATKDAGRLPRRVSAATVATLSAGRALDAQAQVPFAVGRSTPDPRSLSVLRCLGRRHLARLGTLQCDYRDPQGEGVLREAIATYLRAARGVRCDASRIFIVSGSQQAIDLTARTLIDPGDAVWVEDPCYPTACHALALHGARLVPVAVDEKGIDVAAGVGRCADARAAYVTPSHQYPTGSVLAMERRLALLAWAREAGAWVIEDDYDSEFRYGGPPLAALQGLDDSDRVIYVGTFSKALLPGLRVGYLVVPPDLVAAFRAVRALADRFPAPFLQLVVADFLLEGHFAGHLRRLRAVYQRSRDALVSLLQEMAEGHLVVQAPTQGMQLVARSGGGWDDDVAVAAAAAAAGAVVRPVSPMHVAADPARRCKGLVLGFTGFSDAELELGARRLISSQSAWTLPL